MNDLDSFYNLLDALAERTGGPRLLRECSARTGWPRRGVYFFFEPGEVRSNGQRRVVRVGTHALNTGSKSTLWSRLSQHRGQTNGTGNHRGSIFRLHVGAALMARGDVKPVPTWGQKSSAARAVRDTEVAVEQAASAYIGAMPFLWLAVADEPGAGTARRVIEAGSIAILSQIANRHADPPTPNWLGHFAARALIRESGLWNMNHVTGPQNHAFLDVLAEWISST